MISKTDPKTAQDSRRVLAKNIFLVTGAFLVLLFGGVENWVHGLLCLSLAICCFLEAFTLRETSGQISRSIIALIAALFLWILLSLCPWPASWATWLHPGQANLLRDLEGVNLKTLHGSMAPLATLHAVGTLICVGTIAYLAWLWSVDRGFRMVLNASIFILGITVAALGFLDIMDGSTRLYGLRETPYKHWGPFINRNHFANYLNISTIVGLGIFLRYAFPRKDRQGSKLISFLTLAGVIFCGSMSVASASRGGLLSLGLGLVLFTFLLALQRKIGLRTRVMFFGLLFAVGFLMTYGRTVLHRTESIIRTAREIDPQSRQKIWKDVWDMGGEMKGRGIGVGAFETVFPAFQTSRGHHTITHAENEYLQAWVEWGVPGCAIWLTLLTFLILRAVRSLREYPSEWQVAGWSALFVMLVHSMVDFPLHIPSNAWLAAILLGMLTRGRVHPSALSATKSSTRWGLIACSVGLAGICLISFFKPPNEVDEIKKDLTSGNYSSALNKSREFVADWPFYGYAHELTAYSAAGLPSMNREVQKSFRRAQRLSQANPQVSFRAGTLFLESSPIVACNFFEKAIGISDFPAVQFEQIMNVAAQQKDGLAKVIPIAFKSPERWLIFRNQLKISHQEELLQKATYAAMEQWLSDTNERNKILGALIVSGYPKNVLIALEKNPPVGMTESYWQGRAFQSVGVHENAAKIFKFLWMKYKPEDLKFTASIPINEVVLRSSVIDLENIELRHKVAESLWVASRFDEAQSHWTQILAQNPKDEKAGYGLAIAYERKRQWKEAADAWRMLLENRVKIQTDF